MWGGGVKDRNNVDIMFLQHIHTPVFINVNFETWV